MFSFKPTLSTEEKTKHDSFLRKEGSKNGPTLLEARIATVLIGQCKTIRNYLFVRDVVF